MLPPTLRRAALRKLNRRRLKAAEDDRYRQGPEYLETTVSKSTGAGETVLRHLFERQRDLIKDPSKKKAAKCGRRAGKTTTAAAYLTEQCLDRPGALTGYITLTRKQAKRLIWPELKRLNKHYRLGLSFNETDLVAAFPNGSEIWVAGADKLDQIEKFRGVAFLLVVLDECASFKAHIEALIKEVLEPTLEDYDGTVMMIGTPSKACAGLFYEATVKDDTWAKHSWTVLDNPMFPRWRGKKDWKRRAKVWLEALKKKNHWEDDDPVLVREWLAKWVRDRGSMVYLWDDAYGYELTQADIDGFEWHYILGVDLGHDDATAFTEVGFCRDLPWCYIEKSWKKSGMDISDVAEHIKARRLERKFFKIVVDTGGLGKMIVEEMIRRHNLPLVAAEKRDKSAFQETMNADFRKHHIRVHPEGCEPLINEWELLQKDENGEEDDRFDNHCADSALYAWREARHYVYRPKDPEPEYGTPEYWEKVEQEIIEADEADLEELDEVEEMFT